MIFFKIKARNIKIAIFHVLISQFWCRLHQIACEMVFHLYNEETREKNVFLSTFPAGWALGGCKL
jgi:hypothetical protein